MELGFTQDYIIVLKKVFNGVLLKTDKDELFICMRDDGFEFKYNGIIYEAKNGKLNELNK